MKKQMFTVSKLCATALSIMLAFHPVFAQAQKPNISVSIFRDLVRFTAPTEVQAIRVEVVNSTGEKVFEGSLVDGQTQDWPLQDLQDQTVDSAVYSYTITVKDQAGVLKDIQQGNLIIDRAREGLEPAPPPDSRDANSPQNIKPNPTGSWDVDRGKDRYIINTPAMGIGIQTPLSRLHVGAGTTEPITKGSTLILEEGEATGMVLKNTIGAEMFFSQDKNHGLFGTASNHPLGVRTNNLNRLWITGQGNVGIGTINPSSPLTVAGVIETTGGIKFPDGTIQTTAANASSDNPPIAPGNISKGASQNIGVNQDRSSGKKGANDKTVSPEFSVNEDLTVNGNIIFTPALSRDITMAQNTGGIRIFAAPTLTGQPSSAAIQFFGTGHGGFPGQAYIDSGAHDAAAVIFRTAPTGGTIAERMRVTAAGNVGIGTATPDRSLTVASPTSAYVNVKDGTREFLFGVDPNGAILSAMTNHDLILRAGGNNEKMRIAASGNVGIGTATPEFAKLDVRGTDTVVQVRSSMSTIVNGSNNGGAIYFGVDNANNKNNPTAAIETSWGGGLNPQIGIGVTRDFAGNRTANMLLDYSGNTSIKQGINSRLFVQADTGNVGIGTTSPEQKLQVSGAGVVRAKINSNTDTGVLLTIQDSPEWSIGTRIVNTEFGTFRPFSIVSERLGRHALDIDPDSLDVYANTGLNVQGRLHILSNRTGILGFDDNGRGCHWFGAQFDGDLAFGICRRFHADGTPNGYDFRVNGTISSSHISATANKEISYVGQEGPEAGTYIRGKATLVNGESIIDLPEHFGLVTNDEGVTVQLTPRAEWLQLYAAEASTRRIIVREAGGKNGEFSYLIQGVRKGDENREVIRDKLR